MTGGGDDAGHPDSGGGTGSVARFDGPKGIAVDASGNIYVADRNNHTIRKVTSAGLVTTLAGSWGRMGSADGTGADARFRSPTGVAVDSAGNLYVADTFNSTIRRVTPEGVVTTFAGAPELAGSVDGPHADARFDHPSHLAVDSSGNVYVADSGNATIRKISIAGMVTTLAGSPGALGSDDGTGSAARFNNPQGLAVDSAGNLYVADGANCFIRKITAAGVVTTFAGTRGRPGSTDGTGAAAQFNFPSGMALDGAGTAYVADDNNSTIRQITASGVVTTFAGAPKMTGSADGIGAAARFSNPVGVAVDTAGNVYVSDSGNNTIRKITPAGIVTTLAGSPGKYGSTDG